MSANIKQPMPPFLFRCCPFSHIHHFFKILTVMSKRQSGSSAVVVCDDAISGSESDKDVADELRLSMEGLPTDSQPFPIVFFLRSSHKFMQLLTRESLRLRTSKILNYVQSSGGLRNVEGKTWKLQRRIFSAGSKALRHASQICNVNYCGQFSIYFPERARV